MSATTFSSKAFHGATLKSEAYRSLGILCLLGALLIFVVVRGVLKRDSVLVVAEFTILAVAIAHEIYMWRAVRKALKGDREVSLEEWVVNIFIESQIPTVALFVLMTVGWLKIYQVLVAPAILIYLLLIILSTLRLKPMLTFLTGLLSASGYLFVVFVAGTFQNFNSRDQFPMAVYFSYAALILTGGILGAVVAGQIRTHVAAALQEAKLLSQLEQVHHDLEIARSIQRGLLPTEGPALDHFALAGWNRPADETGGDYFDWQSLPDGRLAISLGDATGHGIGPALVMASCRAYARASLLAGAHQNGVLDRLNRLLADDLPPNRFVTFALALLDPKSARVDVLSAGHGPILWYHYNADKMENLEAQGIPLGMIGGVKYEQGTEAQLGPGDMLILITDGFYEWENPEGEEFGIARIETVIRESRDCKPDEVITTLRSAVETFCRGTEQKDDLTVVLLKRNEPGPALNG